jgi:PAS domain-containing protein
MTFFLAVGVAAWIGGFGPAGVCDAALHARRVERILGSGGPLPDLLGALVALGVFAATALALGGITATAHSDLGGRAADADGDERPQASLLAVEATLRSERERLKGLLELIDDAVLLTDGAGLVEHMNPAAERLTRWRLADARGRAVAEVVPLRNATTRARRIACCRWPPSPVLRSTRGSWWWTGTASSTRSTIT